MAQAHYPLGRTERQLQERVQALLGQGERVLAAVVAFTGPRAGIEGLLAPVAGLVALFVNSDRQFTTIAVTDRGVVLMDTKDLRKPVRIRERLASLDALGPMNDTDGDSWIEVAGVKYWIEGIWSPQLYVMRRLKNNSTSTG